MFARLDWNLVVTAHGGRRHDLVRAVRPIVQLRRAGYAEVLVGRTGDVDACLAALAERIEGDAILAAEVLARVVPVERTLALAGDVDVQLVAEVAPFVDALVGRSFHVRVERRGHRRILRSDHLERLLGGALVEALEARGETPEVSFTDPDAILAVEIIGDAVGLGLVTRAHRRHTFVRL
ncbi:MAG: hypothetical protein IT293_08725 [Deltaproteobacteria bacterium]|nr:hypothetical protein [Deltaproteobacteria bacterium]